MQYVYVHTVPNGKIYVGQTKDPIARWNNGEGYSTNKAFYDDIRNYGWKNIKHEIVAKYENLEEALQAEAVLIAVLKAENPNYGYNQTSILANLMDKYATRTEIDGINFEQPLSEDSFFETSRLPVSVCLEMIEQWIFNAEHRKILKDRLIDGMTYPDLSEKYNKSVRQLKNIVYSCCRKLESHF